MQAALIASVVLLLLASFVLIGSGLLARNDSATGFTTQIRAGLWLGLVTVVAALAGLNLWVPVREIPVIAMLFGLSLISAAVWCWRWKPWKNDMDFGLGHRSNSSEARVLSCRASRAGVVILLMMIAVLFVWVSASTASPLTNDDTGGYHLPAISFAWDFSTIPGLGNLHNRYGLNFVLWPFAGALGHLFAEGEGLRFLNLTLFGALLLELALRVTRGRLSPTATFLTITITALLPIVLWKPGNWFISPSPDTAVLLLSLAMTAYFLDAMTRRSCGNYSIVLVVVIGALVVSLRPLMAVYVLGMLSVLIWSRRKARFFAPADVPRPPLLTRSRLAVALMLLPALAIGVLHLVRDYVLTGWLLFPLAIFPLNVDWRTPDPTPLRELITAWAKSPGADWPSAMEGWAWVTPWFSKQMAMGKFYFVLPVLMVLAAFVILAIRRRIGGLANRSHPWPLIAVVMPAVATCVAWVFAGPDPRFIWCPLVTIGGIALTAALFTEVPASLDAPIDLDPERVVLSKRAGELLAGVFVLVAATLMSATALRGSTGFSTHDASWTPLPWANATLTLADFPQLPLREANLSDGTPIWEGECWDAPIPCTPGVWGDPVLIDSLITSGYRQVRQ